MLCIPENFKLLSGNYWGLLREAGVCANSNDFPRAAGVSMTKLNYQFEMRKP